MLRRRSTAAGTGGGGNSNEPNDDQSEVDRNNSQESVTLTDGGSSTAVHSKSQKNSNSKSNNSKSTTSTSSSAVKQVDNDSGKQYAEHVFAESPSFVVKPRRCGHCDKSMWAGSRGFHCQREGCSLALHVSCFAALVPGSSSSSRSGAAALDVSMDERNRKGELLPPVDDGHASVEHSKGSAKDEQNTPASAPRPAEGERVLVAATELGPCPRPADYDDSASTRAAERAFDAELLDTSDHLSHSLDAWFDAAERPEGKRSSSGGVGSRVRMGDSLRALSQSADGSLSKEMADSPQASPSTAVLRPSGEFGSRPRLPPPPQQAAGFGVFAPRNRAESKAMERALRTKLLQDLRSHSSSRMTMPHVFSFADAFSMLTDAAQAIRQDGFTPCFESRKSKPWNFNIYLYPLWLIGLFFRFFVLFPVRLAFLIVGNVAGILLLLLAGALLREPLRGAAQRYLLQSMANVWLASWTAVVRYHGPHPAKRPNQVFVANHTTIFDIIILFSVRVFSVVGQKHPGLMGFFQDNVLNSIDCLWFDRKDSSDRQMVFNSIRQHAQHPTKNPLLLFPEGTCVNNEYCVMFKKGAFEIGATVYPIAIKYNKTFADPFYNSRQQSFARHTFNLLTAWSVVCDVWFLEPQTRQPGESVIDFTNRVKRLIAKKAGLKNVPWDGYLKYFKPSEKFVEEKRKLFAGTLLARYSQANLVDLERSFLDQESDSASLVDAGPYDGVSPVSDRSEMRKTTGQMRYMG